jgi:hypothetical protein
MPCAVDDGHREREVARLGLLADACQERKRELEGEMPA